MRLSVRDDQRGDTIVEVLIATAIISLVLVLGYGISNRNVLAIQRNQERVQAQHLVESQIEALRAQGGIAASGDCFNAGADVSGAACSNLVQSGSGATYVASITPTGAPDTYEIKVVWTSLGASTNGDSNVTMFYRLK